MITRKFISVIFLCFLHSTSGKNDYNFRTSFQQLLGRANFRVVSYTVQTADRYLVTVDRIVPNGTIANSAYSATRKPILMICGVSGASSQFFINAPEPDGGNSCGENIGFCLLKSGRYDVWSLNVRGNGVSAAHLDYDVYDNPYWDFSFDKIARFDLPPVIDLILGETGRQKLALLGYSYGTISALGLLSLEPSWAQKIYPLALWGPVPYMAHMAGVLPPFIPLAKFFIPQSRPQQNPDSMNPNLYMGKICEIFGTICGTIQSLGHGPTTHFNNSRWGEYMRFSPAGSSTSDLLHLAQLYLSKNFSRWDYGSAGNLNAYGSEKAPVFPLWHIPPGFNIFIAYGKTDNFVQIPDVTRLISDLRTWGLAVEEWEVPSDTWNHYNYIAGINATELVNRPTLSYLDSYY